MDERGWTEVEERIEAALRSRSPALRRQLRLLIQGLDWMPLLRYGRRFSALGAEARTALLQRLQRSPALLLRRGFWGLRTLVLLGYYGRPEARRAIGYRADPRGWEARRGMTADEGTGDEA